MCDILLWMKGVSYLCPISITCWVTLLPTAATTSLCRPFSIVRLAGRLAGYSLFFPFPSTLRNRIRLRLFLFSPFLRCVLIPARLHSHLLPVDLPQWISLVGVEWTSGRSQWCLIMVIWSNRCGRERADLRVWVCSFGFISFELCFSLVPASVTGHWRRSAVSILRRTFLDFLIWWVLRSRALTYLVCYSLLF